MFYIFHKTDVSVTLYSVVHADCFLFMDWNFLFPISSIFCTRCSGSNIVLTGSVIPAFQSGKKLFVQGKLRCIVYLYVP